MKNFFLCPFPEKGSLYFLPDEECYVVTDKKTEKKRTLLLSVISVLVLVAVYLSIFLKLHTGNPVFNILLFAAAGILFQEIYFFWKRKLIQKAIQSEEQVLFSADALGDLIRAIKSQYILDMVALLVSGAAFLIYVYSELSYPSKEYASLIMGITFVFWGSIRENSLLKRHKLLKELQEKKKHSAPVTQEEQEVQEE